MKIVVIDGQGGRLGAAVIESIIKSLDNCEIFGIGTNSIAAAAMLKAGAHHGASGENPVVVACRDADVIIGPVGILSADSMLGEITPKMAVAVGQSSAKKLLLPVNMCNNFVVSVKKQGLNEMVKETVLRLKELC